MTASQIPPATLIHIGLPKTATTYMQTAWSEDPAVCLMQQGLLPLINDTRERVINNDRIQCPSAPAAIHFDKPFVQGQKLVLSNEALSSAFLNERASIDKIRSYQELVAARMKRTVAKSKILVVTRSPEKLIVSLYNQAIKQGSVDSFEQFLRREKGFIEQALNIRELFNIWRSHYGADSVLILPMELLRDDEALFYKEIERFSGLPAPTTNDEAPVNTALQDGHIDVMRYFNKWVKMLTEHGRHGGTLPPAVADALSTMRFDVRYTLEYPTPALERRLRLLERKLKTQPLEQPEIPRDLLKSIQRNNTKQLKKMTSLATVRCIRDICHTVAVPKIGSRCHSATHLDLYT